MSMVTKQNIESNDKKQPNKSFTTNTTVIFTPATPNEYLEKEETLYDLTETIDANNFLNTVAAETEKTLQPSFAFQPLDQTFKTGSLSPLSQNAHYHALYDQSYTASLNHEHQLQHQPIFKTKIDGSGDAGSVFDTMIRSSAPLFSNTNIFESEKDNNIKRNSVDGKNIYFCLHEGCGKTFNQKFNLNKHQVCHDDDPDTKLPCLLCHKVFKRKYDLQRHNRKIHDQDWLCCLKCDAKFSSRKRLNEHTSTEGRCIDKILLEENEKIK